MTVSYQPWPQGQTYQYWDIPLATDTGPDDLTNVNIANFTMIFHPLVGNDFLGAGTFSVKVIYPAEILYKPAVADVANTFNGSIIIKAFYPPSNGTADEVTFDPLPFIITPV